MNTLSTKTCELCGKEFQGTWKSKYCCREHANISRSHLAFPDGTDYVECKLCGMRGHDLYHHLKFKHPDITQDEYLQRFNLKYEDLASKTSHEKKSESLKEAIKSGRLTGFTSENNPSNQQEAKDGRNSPFSMNFREYDGLTDEEKIQKIEELKATSIKNKELRGNDTTKISYYTSRGHTEEEAKKLLSERQRTFSLEKCVEKYGEEKGREDWEARQKKWQESLDKLPEKEKLRILKAKASAIKNMAAYSKISQELFWSVYEKIKDKYKKIYFATLKHDHAPSKTNSYEYRVMLEDKIHCHFLDFYVKDINKILEFDGYYWHNQREGVREYDAKREENLRRLGYTNIYRVKEEDYRANPEKVVNECLEFLNS